MGRLQLVLPLLCLACAAGQATPPPASTPNVSARLGETVRLGALTITPLQVVEDSRCPAGVQCVWAGRLRLNLRLDVDTVELELNGPCAPGSVGLTAVQPPARADEPVTARPSRFTFTDCAG